MLSKHHPVGKISTPLLALSRSLLLLFFPALTFAAVQPIATQMQTRPFTHNGYDRPYLIYRPAHLAKNPAVVFMLGGIGSTAKFTSQNFGWTQEADRNGFLVVFPEPVATEPSKPANKKKNITFWQMKGSRTRILAPNAMPVDDDGYLMAVLHDVLRRDHPDGKCVFFAGFSSGSGMVQLLASRHPKQIRAIAAVATPLMDPPAKLARPPPSPPAPPAQCSADVPAKPAPAPPPHSSHAASSAKPPRSPAPRRPRAPPPPPSRRTSSQSPESIRFARA